jgi:hypothetical protein
MTTTSRRGALAGAALLALGALAAPVAAQSSDPRAVVRAGLEAMGGEARLRAIPAVRLAGIGHRNMLEQSERPEGPWIVSYEQVDELRDLAKGRVRQHFQSRDYNALDWNGWTRILSDGGVPAMARGERMGPGRPADAAALRGSTSPPSASSSLRSTPRTSAPGATPCCTAWPTARSPSPTTGGRCGSS